MIDIGLAKRDPYGSLYLLFRNWVLFLLFFFFGDGIVLQFLIISSEIYFIILVVHCFFVLFVSLPLEVLWFSFAMVQITRSYIAELGFRLWWEPLVETGIGCIRLLKSPRCMQLYLHKWENRYTLINGKQAIRFECLLFKYDL